MTPNLVKHCCTHQPGYSQHWLNLSKAKEFQQFLKLTETILLPGYNIKCNFLVHVLIFHTEGLMWREGGLESWMKFISLSIVGEIAFLFKKDTEQFIFGLQNFTQRVQSHKLHLDVIQPLQRSYFWRDSAKPCKLQSRVRCLLYSLNATYRFVVLTIYGKV